MRTHCKDHATYNEYCASCIELDRKESKPTADQPKQEETAHEDHEEN